MNAPPPSTPIVVRHAVIPVSADPLAPPAMLQAASAWRLTVRPAPRPRIAYALFLLACLATLAATLAAPTGPQSDTVAVAGRIAR